MSDVDRIDGDPEVVSVLVVSNLFHLFVAMDRYSSSPSLITQHKPPSRVSLVSNRLDS